ncbi:LuxR C-terminal-related transcriptional regulator [Streptomyces sp. JV185]|uniref:ATP-binding protein n=1 Tax=Streptomyces sp. JV185 TaxID=858638 RepID=UPI002E75E548|nr:LuxR C-terminal-related transcriptional regulator [Streptomyces sp. JV185]MEE1769460.1 LuxR C-terminal-related transcriptional regulator [Streptomyces sp. JV185]
METGAGAGAFVGAGGELTSLIGRRAETARIAGLLSRARLVTLSGVGGVGKTRLALRVAANMTGSFPDGVYVAELADLKDPELLAPSVLGALDVANPGCPGADATAALAARLRERRVLLVLDNCEHLIDACALLADTLLRAVPGLRVLATSRQPLGIAGEQVFPVEPLPVPNTGEAGGAGHRLHALNGNPAVALFVERAAAVLPGFAVTESEATAVAELVRRLDGLPFAIELAAARVRSLTPLEILERLTDRFALLTGGSRVAPDRQRTLRTLIDWSHELCTERERLLWARASVFRGGFDLEGLGRVCADADLPPAALLDTLDALVVRSIVNCRQEQGRSRYHMLETVREYGHERLAASGSADVLRSRHRDHYAELTARAGQEWFGPRQVDWFTRLRLDHPNLRAALEFCLERPGQARAGLALAVSPRHYWITAGLLSEGRRWLSLLLAADDAQVLDGAAGPDAAIRVQAQVTDTYLGILQGAPDADVQRALAACEAAARLDSNRRESAWVWHHHGILAVWREDYASAAELFARARTEFRAQGCLDAALECRAKFAIAHAYGGEATEADEACGEVETAARTHGESWLHGMALLARALLARRADAPADAIAHARKAIARLRPFQDWWDVAMCVEVIAWSTQDTPRRAARLLGVLQLLWESLGGRLGSAPFMRAQHLRFETAVREALPGAAFDREFRRGARATVDEAMAYVLDDAAGVPGLTRRESQVAELVADGLTNKDIAVRLTIAQRTAENHVERLLGKLGLTSRTQLAVWAYEQRDRPAGS